MCKIDESHFYQIFTLFLADVSVNIQGKSLFTAFIVNIM